jgi:NADH-ubiquinone oxidoreductase chain 5
MMIIILIVIFGGCFMRWLIFIDFSGIFLRKSFKLITSVICVFGGVAGIFIRNYLHYNKFNLKRKLNWILGEIWFLPYLSTYRVNYLILYIGYYYYKMIDSGWIEKWGGQGLYNTLIYLSKNLIYLQNKKLILIIYIYIYIIIIFMIL